MEPDPGNGLSIAGLRDDAVLGMLGLGAALLASLGCCGASPLRPLGLSSSCAEASHAAAARLAAAALGPRPARHECCLSGLPVLVCQYQHQTARAWWWWACTAAWALLA